jgi:hypothetical protein
VNCSEEKGKERISGKNKKVEEHENEEKGTQRRKRWEEKGKGSFPFLKLWENKKQSNSEHK